MPSQAAPSVAAPASACHLIQVAMAWGAPVDGDNIIITNKKTTMKKIVFACLLAIISMQNVSAQIDTQQPQGERPHGEAPGRPPHGGRPGKPDGKGKPGGMSQNLHTIRVVFGAITLC